MLHRLAANLLRTVVEGAGFDIEAPDPKDDQIGVIDITARRARPCPTSSALECACCLWAEPSVYSAETLVGFGRPGNRFWPAALDAGIACRSELDMPLPTTAWARPAS